LALIGALLTAPSLFIGFHLDDYVHRYMLSGLPGSAELLYAYESPFGIANGEPATNQWQIEQGYAPWWTWRDLLISLWRPLSEATHRIDAALWPDVAWLQHLHSLAWYALLCAAAALLFRQVHGAAVFGGLAAFFYAVDHAHGLAVGWIANRNAVVSAALGVLSLAAHVRWRSRGWRPGAFAAPALLAAALGAGEGAAAVVGYAFAYAVCVERGALSRRLAALAPQVVLVVVWRAVYSALGHGARGSGLYLDPLREPGRFALAAIDRVPRLLAGQIGVPPAESVYFAPPALVPALSVVAIVLVLAFALVAVPLLRRDALARFWLLGALIAVVPVCATHPNNRLLFFVGLGVLGFIALLWGAMLEGSVWRAGGGALNTAARGLCGAIIGLRLFVSPLVLPVTACSIAWTQPVERAARELLAMDAPELVIVTAPDYFAVKLVPVLAGLQEQTPPRLRPLSFGAAPIELQRESASTLRVRWPDGLLSEPLLELYRSRTIAAKVGERVQLRGLGIEVTEVTPDGRVAQARFSFDADLASARYRVVHWHEGRFAPLPLPAIGERVTLRPERLGL
jgi:hypothetical protein